MKQPKVEVLEKLVIELALIAMSAATIKDHYNPRLEKLLAELQYAGIETPNVGTQRPGTSDAPIANRGAMPGSLE